MIKCNIVGDLLPLYKDGDLSEVSRQFIENHLKECPNCIKLIDPVKEPGGRKRKLRMLFTSMILATVLGSGITWYYGKSVGELTYSEKTEMERKFHQEQLSALEQISPPAKTLLDKWDLQFTIDRNEKTAEYIMVDYSIRPKNGSPVAWVMSGRGAASTADDMLIDESTGTPISPKEGSGSSNQKGMFRSMKFLPREPVGDKVKLKTDPKYVFFKEYGAGVAIKYDYNGDPVTIPIHQKFAYAGIEFSIDELVINEEEYVVRYRQLTPAAEVGIFLLNFAFDDRLGNVWSSFPEADLDVRPVREYKTEAKVSPSRHWLLKVHHVVQVIPGIEERITLREVK